MVKSCPKCNSSDIEKDQARGESYCTQCGTVVESGCIVSEVQFEEGSRGGSHVVGQHIGESGSCRPTVGSMFGNARESRQVTLANAKKKIRVVAEQLRLNNSCMDMAFNFYRSVETYSGYDRSN
jgi:transcription factor IIIB subunit 2